MFYVFRLRYWSAWFKKFELTGRLFFPFVSGWQRVTPLSWWRRWGPVGLVAIALAVGAAVSAPVAHAAMTPEAEAYDNGPIRQTRNPVSGENFHGGVDDSVLDRTENRRQPQEEDKNLFEAIKDTVTGKEVKESPADLQTEKNPTLERYPQSLK